jgi:hypothetical protein
VAVNPEIGVPELSSRSQQRRQSNEQLARSAARLHFVSRVPFLCECNDLECRELVPLFLADYEQARSQPITASGHKILRPSQPDRTTQGLECAETNSVVAATPRCSAARQQLLRFFRAFATVLLHSLNRLASLSSPSRSASWAYWSRRQTCSRQRCVTVIRL